MRASTKRILSILLSGLFLVGLLVVSTVLIKPEAENILEKRRTLFSKKNLFKTQNKAVQDVQKVIEQFQGFKEARAGINLAIPTQKNTTQMIRQLNAISRTAGVSLNSFSATPQPFQESDDPLVRRLGSMRVEISASGSYEDVKNFIRLLESNVRVFDVSSLTVESADLEGNLVNVSAQFNTYFQE